MKWLKEYCKNHPELFYVAVGLLAAIVLTIFIAIIVSAKRKKARKAVKAQAISVTPIVKESKPIAEKPAPVKTPEPVAEKPTPVKEPEPVAEKAAVAQPEKPVEKPAATTKKPVQKKAIEKANVVKVTPIKKEETAKPAEKAAPAAKKPKTVTPPAAYEEDAIEETVKYRGKWAIFRVITEDENHDETYFFELRASNGELLLSSEEYSSYSGLISGIQTHKTNIAKNNFRISLSKKGYYIFKLLNGKNTLLCTGANYRTRVRCESAIESVKRFAETAVIDENVQDQVVKIPPEDNTPIAELAEGVEGKWIIQSAGKDDDKVFYFELFANNGEKLLSSEEYTTYVGAVNGIHTHKKNIESGNFRITLTKRGDYIYKLLNGNGQLLCLGEHYKTKRLCENAVESVKRFSKGSPLLTEQTHIK